MSGHRERAGSLRGVGVVVVPRHTDLVLRPEQPRLELGVCDWPVASVSVEGSDLQVIFERPRHDAFEMKRGAADPEQSQRGPLGDLVALGRRRMRCDGCGVRVVVVIGKIFELLLAPAQHVGAIRLAEARTLIEYDDPLTGGRELARQQRTCDSAPRYEIVCSYLVTHRGDDSLCASTASRWLALAWCQDCSLGRVFLPQKIRADSV